MRIHSNESETNTPAQKNNTKNSGKNKEKQEEQITNTTPLSINAVMPWRRGDKINVNIFTLTTTWITSITLLYFFGLNGPFGRYTIVIQIGIPLYLTYKFFNPKLKSK
ncbi:MAG: hypothetical protein KGZ62_01325 [Sulfurimonas sp.]|nr:hypothetical protein [Sulfurimonas sp.]